MKSKFSLILIVLPLLILLNACRKEGVNLNFKKKEELKSNVRIIVEANWNTSKKYLSVYNISKKNNFHNIFCVSGGIANNNSSFVVDSDNKSIFISTKEVIFQIDSTDGSIIKKIGIAEAFPNNKNEYKFDKLVAVSNSKLFFLISIPKNQIRSNRIYYWKYINEDFISKKTKFRFHTDNIIITSKDKFITAWFYLKNNEPLKIPVKPGHTFDFNFVDYSKEKGWLFSADHPDPDYNSIEFITYVNSKNEVVKLCKGGLAVFGNDDFVYFIREQATIWRISLKTKKEELVFTPSNLFSPKDKIRINFFPPLFNHDKTLMMFPYEQKGKERRDWPLAVIVIFDFTNKEYLIVDNKLNQTSSLRFQNPKWLAVPKNLQKTGSHSRY